MLPRTMESVIASELELGYLAHRADAVQPGVVVIHDVWGLSDHYRDLARRLAADGFSVLAVNLYRRHAGCEDHRSGSLDPRACRIRRGSATCRPPSTSSRSMRRWAAGASVSSASAWAAATRSTPRPVAAASPPPCRSTESSRTSTGCSRRRPAKPSTRCASRARRSKPRATRAARCSAASARTTRTSPPTTSRVSTSKLDASGQPHEVIVYPGAGHAFVNDTRPEMYRPEAARDAWSRMLAWFQRHLAS